MPKTRDLDWDDLRFLSRALKAKTLAGGARSLGVEHSTVGRRLSVLERALGSPLVLRTSDGLRPTPLGEKVVPLIERIERIIGELQDLASSESRRVRLATPSGFAGLLSSEVLILADRHPEISLEIVSGARPVDLMRGEADLAIRSGPVTDRNLFARKLCESGFALYASELYLARRPMPIDLDDLAAHQFIGLDPAFSHAPPARWLAEHAASAEIVMRSREMSDILTAAVAGVGIAVLPCLLASDAPTLRRLTPDVVASHHLWLVYRRELRIAWHVQVVKQWIVDIIGRNKARISGKAAP